MFNPIENVKINRKFKYNPNTNKNEKKKKQFNENRNEKRWKKQKQIIIKKVPRCYTHTGYEFNDIKEIEQLIVPVLISTCHFQDGDITKVELMKIMKTRNKIPQNKIKHNIKLTMNDRFDLDKIDNTKITIGFGISTIQIYKTRMDMEFETKHICEVIMKKCTCALWV